MTVRIAGGGATILEYVNAGLVDELLALAPVLFGSGTRLFEGVDASRARPGAGPRGADGAGDPPDLRSPAAVVVAGRGIQGDQARNQDVHLPRVKVGCQRLSGQKRTEMMY